MNRLRALDTNNVISCMYVYTWNIKSLKTKFKEAYSLCNDFLVCADDKNIYLLFYVLCFVFWDNTNRLELFIYLIYRKALSEVSNKCDNRWILKKEQMFPGQNGIECSCYIIILIPFTKLSFCHTRIMRYPFSFFSSYN